MNAPIPSFSTPSPDGRSTALMPALFTVVIVGGGAAGITVAAELRRHRSNITIAILDPAETHSYQPGWTLVGAGIFTAAQTQRRESTLIPPGVTWIKQAVAAFQPEANTVELTDGSQVGYQQLVVCPGLQLDWGKIEGLTETLGRNGVCSNYRLDTASYTSDCVKGLKGGSALFTQPAMPIKCAGAPQKIMYLTADHLRKAGLLGRTSVEFCLAGDVLFGVPFFVPPLRAAVERYGITVSYKHNLKAVDGPAKRAIFAVTGPDGPMPDVVRSFDMLHVTPPQSAPDVIKTSPLADAAGWVAVDPSSLRHTQFANVCALGDAAGTSNAKTAAAVRLQAPVVVSNLLAALDGKQPVARYDGYGSCPLTTAYGEVVMAEFTYGGTVTPSFPLDPRVPRSSMWHLKTRFLPYLYWNMMLRGSEFDIKHRERQFAEAA